MTRWLAIAVPLVALALFAFVTLSPAEAPLERAAPAPAAARPEMQKVNVATSLAATAQSLPAVNVALSPHRAVAVGEPVDLAATGLGAMPPGVALQVSYDPRLLRPRSSEEIDYTDGSVSRGELAQSDAGEGVLRIISGPASSNAAAAASRRVGLVQFEAAAAGVATLRVSVVALDERAVAAPLAIASCDCRVSIY